MSDGRPRWVALKVRVDCPECGSALFVDGPYKKALCTACGSRSSVTSLWSNLVDNAVDRGSGGTHFRSLSFVFAGNPIPHVLYAVNKGHPPLCTFCDAVLEQAEEVPTGSTGNVSCPSCAGANPTWPAPGFIASKKLRGGLRAEQVFVAPVEDAQHVEHVPDAKPVIFGCLNCGANLKITAESKRVVTCDYCDTDSFLPASVWHRLHPVRKRRAFWLRLGTPG